MGTAVEAGSRRRRCRGAAVAVTGHSGGVGAVGGRGRGRGAWRPRRVAGAARGTRRRRTESGGRDGRMASDRDE
jgi:hypothetical protein